MYKILFKLSAKNLIMVYLVINSLLLDNLK
jgi:hypothetical protein